RSYRGRRMFVVQSGLSLVQHSSQGLERSGADLEYGRLELAPLLALDRQNVTGRVDPAALSIHPGQHPRAPLPGVPADPGEDPHAIDFIAWKDLRHSLRQALPPRSGGRQAFSR